MVTPGLRTETNPMVSVFGVGWTELLIAQVVLIALVVVLTHWDLFRSRLAHPRQRGLGFRDFAQLYYFGRKRGLLDFLWRSPAGWRLNLKLSGYALPRVLIVLGFCVAGSSLASLRSRAWHHFLRATAPWIYILPVALLTVWSIYGFLRREYGAYRRASY